MIVENVRILLEKYPIRCIIIYKVFIMSGGFNTPSLAAGYVD